MNHLIGQIIMDKLRETILLAAKLRRESHGIVKINGLSVIGYRKSLQKCVVAASNSTGLGARGGALVYTLLRSNWNEAIDWANNR